MTSTKTQMKKNLHRFKKNRSFKKRVIWYELGQRRCACCSVQLTWSSDNYPRDATVEHLVPASFGGTYHMVNTLVTCKRCNSLRGTKDWIQFVKEHKFPKMEWLINRYIRAVEFYRTHDKVVYLKVHKSVKQYLKEAA